MKTLLKYVLLGAALSSAVFAVSAADVKNNTNEIQLTQKWDKTFKLSDRYNYCCRYVRTKVSNW